MDQLYYNILPFFNISNEELISLDNNYDLPYYNSRLNIDELNTMTFNQFRLHDEVNVNEINNDPDLNFYNYVYDEKECNYLTADLSNCSSLKQTQNDFAICCHNINSFSKNLESFKTHCLSNLSHNFDVLGFVETKITDDIDNLFTIQNYNKFTNNYKRNSGGLAMFVRDNLEVKQRQDLYKSSNEIEYLFVEIVDKSNVGDRENIICGVVYRRPHTDINIFLTEFATLLDSLKANRSRVYLMGDFNLNLLSYNSLNEVKYFFN